ncbi:MAG: hypothetical protein E7149_08385 [Rikenellaceae bacterium]|nr:hypothetical protein [Rikenellaceae bacterium]
MKNLFNKLVAVLLMAAATVGVSCSDCDHEPYDDTEIKNQIADLYSKVSQLEAKLNADIASLQGMISGLVTVTGHTQDANGNWTITLSDGTKFVVYAEYKPEALPSNLIYVMDHNGEKVWAVMGADGQLTPMTDGEGNPIPVVQKIENPELSTKVEGGYIYISIDGGATWVKTGIEAVENPEITTKEEGGYIYISIDGGKTWIKTGVSTISVGEAPELETKVENGVIYIRIKGSEEWIETGVSADNIEDFLPSTGGTGAACSCNIVDVEFVYEENNYGDEVAVRAIFTLSDGSRFTVDLDGEFGFGFSYYGSPVESLYVAVGTENTNITLWQNQLVDFIKELPMGWNVSFSEQNLYGEVDLTIKAPTAAAIESGVAVAAGDIKLIGVFEGGKTAIAKLHVTTEAFKTVSVSNGQVLIETNEGVDMYTYGILPVSEYTAESVKNTLETTYLPNGLWWGWEAPYHAAYNESVINESAATIYGQELTAGVEYVLWVALLKEEQEGWDYVYSLASDFSTVNFSQILVEAEATNISFNDITVKINFQGFDRYYGGAVLSNYFEAESQLAMINNAFKMGFENSLTTYVNDAPTFEGSLKSFPCADFNEISFNTSYTFWVIPVEEGKTEYAAEDMRVFEWTTKNVTAGGSLQVAPNTAIEPTIDFSSISVYLTPDAAAVSSYYKFYKSSELPAEDQLVAELLTSGVGISADIPAMAYDLESDTEYTLAALAVDSEGKYGEVCTFVYKTLGVTFSETFTLSIERGTIASPFEAATKASFKPTVAGGTATEYYYFNLTDAEIANWGSDEAIAKELVLNEQWSRKVVRSTALDTNGCFTVQNLKAGTQYTLFIVATDGEAYTKMQKMTYTPQLDVKIIPATDAAWENSKPTVTINTAEKAGYSYSVNYTVTPAAGTKVDGGHFMNVYTNGKSVEELLAYMMTATASYHYVTAIETEQTYAKSFNVTSAAIWVTWTDAEGNYYEPMKVEVTVE